MHDSPKYDHTNDPLRKHGSDRTANDAWICQHIRCDHPKYPDKRDITPTASAEEGGLLACR